MKAMFFTPERREVISRTILDTWKITVPTTLASGFFLRYNWLIGVAAIVALFIFFAFAVVIFPTKPETERRN